MFNTKTHKIVSLLMVVALLVGIMIIGASAVNYSGPSIKATLMSQDPDPVEPGQMVKVKFKIENEGMQSSQDTIVKLLPKYPFSLYGDITEKNIGKLQAASTGADAVIVEFNVKVDESAVEEDTELELQLLTGENGISYTNNEFMISIQTHDAVLAITSITSEPSPIAPGNTASVSIMVKNTADSLLKDINFKLDMNADDTPIAPYQSSSERIIPQLQSNYQQTLTFNVIAEPDAASGLYKVPLTITYNDEMGTSYSYEDVLAVMIGEKPKINTYVKKSTVMEENAAGKVTIEVANAGNTDLKYLELTLLPSDDYKLITTRNYFYLGNLASDDTQSEEVEIYINDLNKDENGDKIVHIPGQLKYVDANNQNYQQAFDLELKAYSSSQLKKFGVIQSGNGIIYVFIIILGVGGYFAYKKYKKKNGNGKK